MVGRVQTAQAREENPYFTGPEAHLGRAVVDAKHLSEDEADVRVGALIVSTYWLEHKDKEEKEKRTETLRTRLREFSNSTSVQFSWEVYPGGVQSGTTFFYLTTVP